MKSYEKSSTALFVMKVMKEMKKMQRELNEHRYYLERNVERRTEHLSRRIALLESCNTALCTKLATAHKKMAELKQLHTLSVENGEKKAKAVKLYLLDTQRDAPAQGWEEHVSAA